MKANYVKDSNPPLGGTGVKLRPALFMSEMIQAIFKQWKTITRRLNGLDEINKDPDSWKPMNVTPFLDKNGRLCFVMDQNNRHSTYFACPYGNVGDVLWARESGWVHNNYMRGLNDPCLYWKADYELYDEVEKAIIKQNCGFFPNIHMYFEFTRIFLKITEIKLERLKDISEEDAIAEGVHRYKNADDYFKYVRSRPPSPGKDILLQKENIVRKTFADHVIYKQYIHNIGVPGEFACTNSAKESFIGLFHHVNKPQKSMDLNSPLNNPWVWAIRFEVLSTIGNPDPDLYKIAAQKQLKANGF